MFRLISLSASALLLGSVSAAAPPSGGAAPAQGGGGGGGGSSHGTIQGPTADDFENMKLIMYMSYIWIAIIGAMFIHRLTLSALKHMRNLACMNNDKQKYFADVDPNYASAKKHLLDAPLLSKRHNREVMLSSAINVGTIPSRLQTLFIVVYFGINIAFAFLWLDYDQKRPALLKEIRNRTGVLSFTNMIPLFLFAGRNNFLIKLLDVSFDSYNMMHRWLGRIAVLHAIAHTVAYCVSKIESTGLKSLTAAMAASPTILTGTIGTCAFLFLMFHSPSVVRHAYYEVFLHAHILVAITALVVLWMHIDGIPVQLLILTCIIIWGFERFLRVQNLIRNNVGAGGTTAEVEAMPGDALRVTLRIARPWKFQPGQHVYLYLPTIGWWTNHPFSLAWSDDYQDVYSEKGVSMERQDILAIRKTTMSLIIRRRTGFTDKLWSRAENAPQGRFVTKAFVEGPYGHQNLNSYGTVMLFAAGVGITHQVPFLRSLVADYANGTCATRRVTLVWIIQSPEHLEWIRPWMTDILGMDKRRDILKIQLFITRPRSTKEIHSPSASVQMFPGKPDVSALIAQQQQGQVGAMAVSVCGTGSLSDDVRYAVRQRCQKTTIDFVENAFSW
ncbi:ferric/cupric reductase transmembrane component-like protein 4 [Elsinoe australis]|uniref:ferric-chelate reductase (NADPH) n=1 Tax=Elsinoe australis TaxID=40998 RepID=A0A4U7B463_9PEZI|nr:ferric/cupric reductase transmembrane component-like protein 4 [Elsinoe australis]